MRISTRPSLPGFPSGNIGQLADVREPPRPHAEYAALLRGERSSPGEVGWMSMAAQEGDIVRVLVTGEPVFSDRRSGRSLKLPGMTCGLPGAPS